MTYDPNAFVTGEVSYTDSEKELRDKFIVEYLRDYNSYAACVRLGYMDEMALEEAQKLMEEPYVKRGIADAEAARAVHLSSKKDADLSKLPDGFVPHEEETDRQRIVSGLFREAFYKGPGSTHSSRVAALSALSKIYKLDKEEEKVAEIVSRVMVVPAVGNVDDWEQAASEQQAELKRTVTQ
ncbi:MAG: hypothetical protein CMO80_22180 [Verrucomicrobiales bacterium]|nr:hypothetical protein [Verrucomicrobiales bacterium]|tara:strand:+ start:28620 stop:29165 length:546 start_codon:yes stop_codon:yes gene_type:complete